MVKSELDEGLGTLDVAVVVAHNHQVVIVLLGPVVIELDRVLGQRLVHEDLLDLVLQLLGGGPVQVVGEPDIDLLGMYCPDWFLPSRQAPDDVQLAHGLVPGVAEGLVLDQGALAGLHQAGQVLLEQAELCGLLSLGRLLGPDHHALGPENPQRLGNIDTLTDSGAGFKVAQQRS